MSVPTRSLPQANDARPRRISVDAYYGVPKASEPTRPVVADFPSYRPVLSQAQLLQLDPHDRQLFEQLQRSLKSDWRCTERAYHIERERLEVSMHESRS